MAEQDLPIKEDANATAPQPEKKKRGKPKDANAPPKPKNPYGRFTGECRARLKEERPELVSDLSGMGKALAEEWGKVPQEKKDEMQKEYEKEMAVWKPLWAEYKETDNFKDFVEEKTDWLDIRARKKLQKKMTVDAPKRPRSGYMIFAGEVREAVMAEVKEKGLGMGDGGRIISEKWNALSEAEKSKYGDMSAQQKKDFDVKWAVYIKGEGYKNYRDEKAKLEAKQGIKKITRTELGAGPKRAQSSYALYRAKVMPDIVKENEAKAEGEKLAMGDITKKVSTQWAALSEEKKKTFNEVAAEQKKAYEQKFMQFKVGDKYRKFIETRQKIKAKENKELRLRDLPKRPKSVFSMFCDEHKSEVEPGKGEGKGRDALQKLWASSDADKKRQYQEKEAALKEKWQEDMQAFKEGTVYKTYEKTCADIKREFESEAIKITTMKFLREAPPAPAKTPFAVFLGEKRKREQGEEPENKSKAAKAEEVNVAKKEWNELASDIKKEYEVKRKESLKGFEQKCKEYMETDRWKEYVQQAKQMRIPVKSILYHKKKIIKKYGKGEKMPPSAIPMPDRPDTFPEKPKTAQQFFIKDKRLNGVALANIPAFPSLPPEEKKEWEQKAAEDLERFKEETTAFKASDEGKAFFRSTAIARRRRIMLGAKNKYLDHLPKKPMGAVATFMKDKFNEVRKANKGKKNHEIKKLMNELWTGMESEQKNRLEEEARERESKFKEDLAAFKDSDNWKNFQKAIKPKAKAISVPIPASMPKKPANAFNIFKGERGDGKTASEVLTAFKELEPEQREEYSNKEKEAQRQYQEDLINFNKSPEGKKYFAAKRRLVMMKAMKDAKARFLVSEPKKGPATAFAIFLMEKKAEVAEEFGLKGPGPVQAKLTEMWKELDKDELEKWTEKFDNAVKKHQEEQEEWKNSDNYKKYQAVVRRFAPKKAGKGKSKGGPSKPQGPAKPENMPNRPLSAMNIYGQKMREEGKSLGLKELGQSWVALGADGQKEYVEQAQQATRDYDTAMAEFRKTAEGKRFFREKGAMERKEKGGRAKAILKAQLEKDSQTEPKRPPSAYFIFVGDKRGGVEGGLKEVASKLSEMWKNIDKEEKDTYEAKAKELKEKYDEELAAYKNSDAFKKYSKMMDAINGKKAQASKAKKAKAKAAPKARGRGGKGAGRGGGGAKDSDSDVMGSDSDSDSSSSSSD